MSIRSKASEPWGLASGRRSTQLFFLDPRVHHHSAMKRKHFVSRQLLVHRLLPLVLIVALLLALPGAALAQEPVAPAAPGSANELDDGLLEVGVEYVNNYENCGGWGLGYLGITDDDALSLRNRLTAVHAFSFFPYPTPRWNANWTWGNGSAWQSDWTKSPAGSEDYYIDNVDFAYFAGHGASSGFFMGVGGNRRNGCQVTKAETAGTWGTREQRLDRHQRMQCTRRPLQQLPGMGQLDERHAPAYGLPDGHVRRQLR